jgi:hypothetical protein
MRQEFGLLMTDDSCFGCAKPVPRAHGLHVSSLGAGWAILGREAEQKGEEGEL